MKTMKVGLITGDHPFDVLRLYDMFRGFDDMEVYPQHIVDFATDTGAGRKSYDALVFYNMTMATPTEDAPNGNALKKAIEGLGSGSQGIVLLHHSLLAFPEMSIWSEMVGVRDRSFGFYDNQSVHYTIEDSEHPILLGLSEFDMVDETYTMAEPGNDSTIIMTTSHEPSSKSIAWCRTYLNSKVFCYQSGHDATCFTNPNFQTILGNGIRWSAGQL